MNIKQQMPSERLQTAFVFQEAKEWGGQFIYIKTFGAVKEQRWQLQRVVEYGKSQNITVEITEIE